MDKADKVTAKVKIDGQLYAIGDEPYNLIWDPRRLRSEYLASLEAERQATQEAYGRHLAELTLAHKDRERRPLRKTWNR